MVVKKPLDIFCFKKLTIERLITSLYCLQVWKTLKTRKAVPMSQIVPSCFVLTRGRPHYCTGIILVLDAPA